MVLRDGAGNPLRLPQDVAAGDVRGRPDLGSLSWSVGTCAIRHALALERGDHHHRAEACWGLIARGPDALPWCESGLDSGEPDRQSDAAGVLRWVGVPELWRPRLRALLDRLPGGEVADALLDLLPEVAAEDAEPTAVRTEPGLLFEGLLLPFTEPIWYVELPLADVLRELLDWMSRLTRAITHLELREPLPDMLERLEPWAMPSWCFLLVETTGPWTAVFTQGSDQESMRHMVSRPSGARNLHTHYSRHVVRDRQVAQYGDRSLWMSAGGDHRRSIQASQQGRWEWDEHGDPLPFERTERYRARRIPDRFTLEHLNEYCRALGIARADPAFYRPHGYLIEERRDWSPGRTMSRAEWQDDHLRS